MSTMDAAGPLNDHLCAAEPAAWPLLSELGRRAVFPPGIPQQAAEARGKRINATIGQVTDGHGRPLVPEELERALAGLSVGERDRAFLYSPIAGADELRRLWRERQERQSGGVASRASLPLVTVGLTHGLSLVADLFVEGGRAVAAAAPFWGNYRQTFELRRGGRLLTGAAYRAGRFNPRAIVEALAEEPAEAPAVGLLNFPSNPGGYSPTAEERRELIASLVEVADQRPLLAVCDDAYAGLVYEPGVPERSLFWDLLDLHPRLVAVKVDGATKEFSFFGGRVGFLTFPFAPDSGAAAALESKVKCLLRATVGSPVAASQAVLTQALQSGRVEGQMAPVRDRLAARYRVLVEALAAVDRAHLQPLPFNSGCFALIELAAGLDAEAVRRRLLERFDTGVIAIPPRHLRIAFCSVDRDTLPELVRRIELAVAELARTAP